MRAAAFPLAYLIFMVPMPDAMADALETASKYASAEVANLLFHLSGTPFLRAGLIFQLPNITIEVAQECSGIRSSWVLFMTSILAANLFLKTPMAAFCACRLRHSACHFAERISHPRDRASLRECRPADDSQPDPPPRRARLFRAFADSIFLVLWWLRKGRPELASRTARASQRVNLEFASRHFLSFYANFRELCLPVSVETLDGRLEFSWRADTVSLTQFRYASRPESVFAEPMRSRFSYRSETCAIAETANAIHYVGSEQIVSPNSVLALAAAMFSCRPGRGCGLSKAAFACDLVFLGWDADFRLGKSVWRNRKRCAPA